MNGGQIKEGLFYGALLFFGGTAGDRAALLQHSGAVEEAQNLAGEAAEVVADTPEGSFSGEDAITAMRVLATADTVTVDGPIQVVRTGEAITVTTDTETVVGLAADNVADTKNHLNNQRWLYRAIGGSTLAALGAGAKAAWHRFA